VISVNFFYIYIRTYETLACNEKRFRMIVVLAVGDIFDRCGVGYPSSAFSKCVFQKLEKMTSM